MSETKALIKTFDNSDRAFFAKNPERQAHIRLPYKGESEGEFWSLGEHVRTQRHILLWRVPKDNPYYEQSKQGLLKIPFLAYVDEEIADSDEVLLPVVHEIMMGQAPGAA